MNFVDTLDEARALECWRLHRREWESAAKKGIGYSSYKALANAVTVPKGVRLR